MSARRPPLAWAALTSRCPNCGRASVFQGFLRIRPECPVCHEDFARAYTGDGPAVFVMFLVGAIVVPVAFVLQFAFGWPAWAIITVVCLLTLGLSLALLRPFKSTLFAIQWRMKAEEGRLESLTHAHRRAVGSVSGRARRHPSDDDL